MMDSKTWGPIHEMMDSKTWGPIHEIGQIQKHMRYWTAKMWGPISKIGRIRAKIYSRCTVIDFRGPHTLQAGASLHIRATEECLEGVEGVSTDTIHLGDLGFVIFILARH